MSKQCTKAVHNPLDDIRVRQNNYLFEDSEQEQEAKTITLASNQLADQQTTSSQNLIEKELIEASQEPENHDEEFNEINLQLIQDIGGPSTPGPPSQKHHHQPVKKS